MTAPAAQAKASGGFNPAVVAAVLIVGLIAFVAFFAGNAFDTGPKAELDTNPHAASKSAVGFAGAVELLRRAGRPAVATRGPIVTGRSKSSVMVVTLDSDLSRSVFAEQVVKRHSGPILVVLPKWATGGDPGRIGWVRKRGLLRGMTPDVWLKPPAEEGADPEGPKAGSKTSEDVMREVIESRRSTAAPSPDRISLTNGGGEGSRALYALQEDGGASKFLVRTGAVDRMQTFRFSPGWVPVIIDEEGRAVLVASEEQDIYVLAEPDLMNTHGIADINNARAMLAMLDEVYGRDASYIFDLSMHGLARSRSFLKQAFQPPFLAATLCGLATALLMGWHAFVRFGRARQEGRAFAMGKRALADNQADLIKMTGREHRMGAPYATVVRDAAARAVGAPRDLSPEALDTLMDRLGEGGRTSWPLSTLRDDLAKAKDVAELQKAAERLHHWRMEMTKQAGG